MPSVLQQNQIFIGTRLCIIARRKLFSVVWAWGMSSGHTWDTKGAVQYVLESDYVLIIARRELYLIVWSQVMSSGRMQNTKDRERTCPGIRLSIYYC